jgi:hypothetical protein
MPRSEGAFPGHRRALSWFLHLPHSQSSRFPFGLSPDYWKPLLQRVAISGPRTEATQILKMSQHELNMMISSCFPVNNIIPVMTSRDSRWNWGYSPRLYHMSLISKPICLLISPYLESRERKTLSHSTKLLEIRLTTFSSAGKASHHGDK